MAKKTDVSKQIIDAAMSLAAERGWRDLALPDIAAAAGLSLAQVYPVYRSKAEILEGLSRQVDAAVVAEHDSGGAEETARDRLFDVLMCRFDALQPYKDGLANILLDQGREPVGLLCGAASLRRSMALMLELAGLSTDGLRGAVRIKGLMGLYLATLRVWLRDDSPDLAKTMASLDGYLRRIEGWVGMLRRRGRADPETEAPPPAADSPGPAPAAGTA